MIFQFSTLNLELPLNLTDEIKFASNNNDGYKRMLGKEHQRPTREECWTWYHVCQRQGGMGEGRCDHNASAMRIPHRSPNSITYIRTPGTSSAYLLQPSCLHWQLACRCWPLRALDYQEHPQMCFQDEVKICNIAASTPFHLLLQQRILFCYLLAVLESPDLYRNGKMSLGHVITIWTSKSTLGERNRAMARKKL